MAKLAKLTDADVLRFQRFSVTESAAATFTQTTFDTQLSIERGVIWLIHSVEWMFDFKTSATGGLTEVAVQTQENIQAQVTRESKSAILQLSDSDLVCKTATQVERANTIGTEAGPLYLFNPNCVIKQNFALPIPYAAQNIYVAILSTAGTARTVYGRIHYTLVTVSDSYFYRVAQSLLG